MRVRPGQLQAVDVMCEGDLVPVHETLRDPESHRRMGQGRVIGYAEGRRMARRLAGFTLARQFTKKGGDEDNGNIRCR